MPNWPAAKLMDMVVGVDFHTLIIPPAPAPVPFIPHPYFGPIYLWHTPLFPKADVFINGMPALSVGAMGYYAHIPQGVPNPPTMTNCPSYWRRYVTNIPMALGLMMLTTFANIAVGLIAAVLPKNATTSAFVKDVTGIDPSSSKSLWESVKGSFSSLTKWSTWVKLLLPPLPYPGDQGSAAIGSPNVTVNGGPLGFVAPLMATSCTEMPFSMVPNAAVLGFSNVLVGVSLAGMARGIAVHAAQAGVSAAAGAAAGAIRGRGSGGRGVG